MKTAVLGATGYAGYELVRLLLRHPKVKTPLLLSREGEGSTAGLDELYPALRGDKALPLEPFSWDKLKEESVKILFLATPHELSRDIAPEAIERGMCVIDLSGAWRLKDAANRAVYGFKDKDAARAARWDKAAVYGMPELYRAEIPKARLIANPGCYATSVILGLAPLAKAGLIDRKAGVVCDCKSGVSGAGKKPTAKTHFVEVAGNFSAYSVFGHRHTGEILEQTGLADGELTFTPHLLPIPRGILSTLYVRLAKPATAERIDKLYHTAYPAGGCVRLYGAGALPQIQYSLYTNYCDIGFELSPDGKRLTVVTCLDNLMKGAAGQALQNMNLMCGWDEKEGLQ
ncbi:MAG TPA: N-acetyl-gamma-glutamyl-phosphate reductase [Elusimicrobia bacterium]|nr:N-acetyl-gamma-glutamyl-phosphate reductase [Elusimicrobiota bacterium]